MQAQEFPITKLLDTLCPMHLVLDRTGHIVHAGPTLRRLDPEGAAPGSRFTELFEIRRPRIDGTMAALREHAGEKLHLQMRGATRADLKAVVVPLPEAGGPEAGAIGPRGGGRGEPVIWHLGGRGGPGVQPDQRRFRRHRPDHRDALPDGGQDRRGGGVAHAEPAAAGGDDRRRGKGLYRSADRPEEPARCHLPAGAVDRQRTGFRVDACGPRFLQGGE